MSCFIETSDERTRIKVAARNGQLKALIKVQLLSKFSNDVKMLSEILIESCRGGQLDVVKWMVEHTAADVNYTGMIRVRNSWGEEVDVYHTPLTAACRYENLDVVKYLVETSRVDINLPDSEWGHTPLIRACHSASMSVAMYLLSKVSNLDVNIASRRGDTAMHYVLSCSKDNGHTQLHKACMKGDKTEVMKFLSVKGHMINVLDNAGYTSLHYACHLGYSDIVKTLMLAGADETITDMKWQTPAQLAKKKGHRELIKLLDRVTLLKEMQTNNFNKLSVCFLIMLTLQLMQVKLMRKKWCRMLTVVHVMLKVNKCYYIKHKHRKVKKTKHKCILLIG